MSVPGARSTEERQEEGGRPRLRGAGRGRSPSQLWKFFPMDYVVSATGKNFHSWRNEQRPRGGNVGRVQPRRITAARQSRVTARLVRPPIVTAGGRESTKKAPPVSCLSPPEDRRTGPAGGAPAVWRRPGHWLVRSGSPGTADTRTGL